MALKRTRQERIFLGPSHMLMPDLPVIAKDCRRLNGILSLVGDKWTVSLVMVLHIRPLRFNELRRAVGGISQQMLTRTLKALERDGMVDRTVYSTVPPQVQYALTPLGHSLSQPIRDLGEWAECHLDEIETNRCNHDAAADQKSRLRLALPSEHPPPRHT